MVWKFCGKFAEIVRKFVEKFLKWPLPERPHKWIAQTKGSRRSSCSHRQDRWRCSRCAAETPSPHHSRRRRLGFLHGWGSPCAYQKKACTRARVHAHKDWDLFRHWPRGVCKRGFRKLDIGPRTSPTSFQLHQRHGTTMTVIDNNAIQPEYQGTRTNDLSVHDAWTTYEP